MTTPQKPGWLRLLIKLIVFIFLCLLCQNIFGAIFVLGWTYRLMRRRSIFIFSSISDNSNNNDQCLSHPNLFKKEKNDDYFEEGAKSFFRNIKMGLLALVNTSFMLAPGFILWMYAWYAGWQISFNKSYEYSSVGALLGVLGVILFSLAMLYVPMAQARFAFTQQWKTFYQFRVNMILISQQVKSYALFALLILFFAVFTNLFKTLPMFFSGMNLGIEDMSDEQLLAFMKNYFFVGTFIVMPLFFIIKRFMAKLFAKALILSVQRELLSQKDLSELEWKILNKFNLTEVDKEASSGLIWSLIKKNTSRVFKAQMLLLTFLLWTAFCFQIFVSEFLNYHNNEGWVNQPLIQLPYFKYIPNHLTEPEEHDQLVTPPKEMSDAHPILK
ncbi:MAG: hypothetical protein COA79_10115 [Planctomycetota bacterium]|nr:MAG: hypothetical protein COA79_10115 [Planctomycetota bacterium]